MQTRRIMQLLLSVIALTATLACTRSEPTVREQDAVVRVSGSGGINAAEHIGKPIVLMVSIDGFRHDYLEKFKPPHLNAIADAGLKATSMQPGFPSLTFPNHISLVTGLYPGHHGIVSNTFYDKSRDLTYSIADSLSVNESSWYLAETLWSIAEKNRMVSAVYFWVGSEAKIGGVDPSYLVPYNGDIPNADRVKKVMEWLSLSESQRPHLIGLYFSDVDSMGHKYGTESAQLKKSVLEIDELIGQLDKFIEENHLPVNLMIMSDHGMRNLEKGKVIEVGRIADLSGFTVGDRGPVMMLYSSDEDQIDRAFSDLKKAENHFKVFRRSQAPKEYFFDHPTRVGDLVIEAEIPYYLITRLEDGEKLKLNTATHGWDPSNTDMHAFFVAKGPQIKKGVIAPTFENIHVFPFVLQILGLPSVGARDGSLSVLAPYLASP